MDNGPKRLYSTMRGGPGMRGEVDVADAAHNSPHMITKDASAAMTAFTTYAFCCRAGVCTAGSSTSFARPRAAGRSLKTIRDDGARRNVAELQVGATTGPRMQPNRALLVPWR